MQVLREPLTRAATVLLVMLAVLIGAGARAGASDASVFQIVVSGSPTSGPIAPGFLGLGLEYSTVPKWEGRGSGTGNPLLARLIRNLAPVGRPVLRIGGQSTDRAWWPVPGMRKSPGITYTLTPGWVASARRLARALDGKLLLGLNLEADRPRIDRVEAARLVDGIGRRYIRALEIGNEPLLYPAIPWFRRLGARTYPWWSKKGEAVYSRGRGYGPAQFATEFARVIRVLPRVPLAGPETGNPQWLGAFRQFVTPRSRVRMLTSHVYPLSQCITDPSSPYYPTVAHLLSLPASRSGLLIGIHPYIELAHANGASYRVDGMGSVTCNGHSGVSNTMASALWVMDTLFWIAHAGIDGVNLHSQPSSSNGLFDFRRTGAGWSATVHPIYYGALMFERAAPAGSRLLGISGSPQQQLRAWATRGADRRVRVLLINDSLTSRAQVLVRPPAGSGSAVGSIEFLTAASAYSTGGLRLGGRSFGRSTSSGTLATAVPRRVAPHGGEYSVSLSASSAALLTLQGRVG